MKNKNNRLKPRLLDGLPTFDIVVRDGVSPVVKRRRARLDELDALVAEIKKKFR